MKSDEIVTKADLELLRTDLLEALSDSKPSEQQTWLRSKDVIDLLKISSSTLQNLRTSGALTFYKLQGSIFFKYEDVINSLEKNKREGGLR